MVFLVMSQAFPVPHGSQLEGLWHTYTIGEKLNFLHILYRIVLYQHLVLFSLAHLEESQETAQVVNSTFHSVHTCTHLEC